MIIQQNNITGDLSVARMKALEAESTSDLNSDSDLLGLGHRKIRMNKKYQDSESSEQDKEDSLSPEASKIMMPTLKRREEKTSGKIFVSIFCFILGTNPCYLKLPGK